MFIFKQNKYTAVIMQYVKIFIHYKAYSESSLKHILGHNILGMLSHKLLKMKENIAETFELVYKLQSPFRRSPSVNTATFFGHLNTK